MKYCILLISYPKALTDGIPKYILTFKERFRAGWLLRGKAAEMHTMEWMECALTDALSVRISMNQFALQINSPESISSLLMSR